MTTQELFRPGTQTRRRIPPYALTRTSNVASQSPQPTEDPLRNATIDQISQLPFSHTHDHHISSGICEQCCYALVAPKYKWVDKAQEVIHSIGEIAYFIGKWSAGIFLCVQFIVEAIFPHLYRQKDPIELERERLQREWEEEREKNAQHDLEKRMQDDASEEAAYLSSLKVKFHHPHDAYFQNEVTHEYDKQFSDLCGNPSDNPELERLKLRKLAVEAERLSVDEARRIQRRSQLQQEVDHHAREKARWEDRAYAASDSKEKRLCEQEAESHKWRAYHAKIAYENI